jgi:ABC-type bacteriocin/lantibiotic exporter with double-glycine peptidase domain
MVRALCSALLGAAVLVCLASAAAQEAHWLDVPFVSQPKEGCGAAVISMTLQYWKSQGSAVDDSASDVATIQSQLYSPGDHGIKASAMTRYFEDHGFHAIAFAGTSDDLEKHVAKGRPLIVALKESKDGPVLHYVVVAGIDPPSKIVLVNDPAQRKLLKMDFADFERAWAGTKNWTLLVLPKS